MDIVLILSAGLAVGVSLTRDYGLSWDEYTNQVYARDTIGAYLGVRSPDDTLMDLKYYGPAFNVAWLIARNFIAQLVPNLPPTDAGHFVYFLSFLAGVIFFYSLARRIAGRGAGLAATLIFVTQPAVFGHAFVNPKDIPFMTSFLAAVWAGLRAGDALGRSRTVSSMGEGREGEQRGAALVARWRGASWVGKLWVILLWLAVALMTIDLFATHLVLNGLLTLIGDAYAGRAPGPVQFLFARSAQDAWKTPVEAYLEKARLFYTWSRYAVLLGGAVLVGWLTARVLGALPEIRRWRVERPWPALFLAAALLGLCIAIRVFGPFAGGLVSISFLIRLGRRAWLALGVYWMVAAIVLYAAWPYLWGDPVGHLMEALQRMSRFPWMGRVLYDGLLYSVPEIPWHYVPRSMLFQLTLPAILIGGLGLWVALAYLRDPSRRADVVLLLVWLSLPLLAVVTFGAHIYDAFRQMMFILPPLFLLAAIGFRYLFNLLSGIAWRGLLVAIAVLPGLVAIARLHPYEYIYYNELAGGVRGAFRRYELDGWCISYREAIEYLNEIAPPLSRVLVPMESHTVEPFAREDLVVDSIQSDDSWLGGAPGFAIVCTRGNADLRILPENDVVWAVERDGALLTVIKRLP